MHKNLFYALGRK